MKTTAITNLLLLSSLTLFTACSQQVAEPSVPKKSLSTSFVSEATPVPLARTYSVQPFTNSINNLPLARTYPIASNPINSLPLARTYPVPTRSYYEESRPSYYQEYRPITTNYVRPSYPIYHYNPTKVIQQVERGAKRLLGRKYVWGATGPVNYDCSGFTQKIYRDAGINIPRVSRDQARVGQYVSFNQLRKGDMVFFDTHKKRTGKVSHVGIYLGNGNFIHASSGAKKVVIFNFNEKKFYRDRFLWGRRVIKDNIHYAMR